MFICPFYIMYCIVVVLLFSVPSVFIAVKYILYCCKNIPLSPSLQPSCDNMVPNIESKLEVVNLWF